ncbi:MAG: DUF642 domain-containing protein [Armatimonadota bacterium]
MSALSTTRFSRVFFASAVLAGTLLTVPSAQAQLVNGSFETGTFSGSNPQGAADSTQLQNGATSITGWTVVDELAWHGPTAPYGISASNGGRYLDLTGYSDNQPHGGVQQVLALTVGNSYRLSFDIGYSQLYSGTPTGVTVTSTGAGSQTFNYSGVTNVNSGWQTFAYDFTATSAATTILLRGSAGSAGNYIGLDNVALAVTGTGGAAAPEPGSLALLLPVLGAVGMVVRRRKR